MMNKTKKKTYIEEMKNFFSKSSSIFVTHYQCLTVKQIDKLREEMRKHGIFFKITKNRITKLASGHKTGLQKDHLDSLPKQIIHESKKYGYDPLFLAAVIITESSFNNWA